MNDSKLVEVAQQCSEITEEELGWSANDLETVLRNLRQLSLRASETGKRMYLWNSL